MKELSIEEKAKAYDEALEKAKAIYNKDFTPYCKDALESIFPELKESDDERIRKDIVFYIAANHKDDGEKARWLYWLEKKGNKSNWKPSKDEMDALYELAYITNKMDDKKDEAVTKLYQDLKREFFNGVTYENMFPSIPVDSEINIEKQGEQKPADKVEPKDYSSIDPHFEKPVVFKAEHFYVSKVDGQIHDMTYNPANKVEPKFHEGDWAVSNLDGKARQISEVHFVFDEENEYNSYYVVDGRSVNLEEYDRLHHLWSIKDAKPGDVLVDVYGNIGIFEKIYGINWLTYCYLWNGGLFVSGGGYHGSICYPATKEQRDTLEKAMADAGYKWNKEDLKLEKI